MSLKTRKPTGVVPWPLLLVEGGEKSGKSYAAAVLTASAKVGRSLWLDLAEGAADEYGAIPGARYEVIDHDGTWPSIMEQVREAKAEAARAAEAGELPVVLIVDSVTAEWEMLKDWASDRARKTKANKAKLASDPNAEVIVTMNFWNDAASRHRQFMTVLMTFPGIVVLLARGGDVALVENGKPVEGQKAYRVEGHKSLAFDATCWIRLNRDRAPIVVGARSVHMGMRPGLDPPKALPEDWGLEWVIFEALRCNPATAHVRDLVDLRPAGRTPEEIRDEACDTTTTFERIKELYAEARDAEYDGVALPNESGDDELLLAMLVRLGNERGGNAQPAGRPVNGHPGTANGAVSHPAAVQDAPPEGEPPSAAQAGAGNGQPPQRARAPKDGNGNDEEWIRDFKARLREAREGDLTMMRREVGQAVMHRKITPDTSAVLTGEVATRRRELEGASA